jgi:hypothetical protein
MKDWMLVIGVFVVLAWTGWAMWGLAQDCSRRGGELVKGFSGSPVCVEAPKVKP